MFTVLCQIIVCAAGCAAEHREGGRRARGVLVVMPASLGAAVPHVRECTTGMPLNIKHRHLKVLGVKAATTTLQERTAGCECTDAVCRVLSTEERAQKRFRQRRLLSTCPKPVSPAGPAGPARSASLPATQPPSVGSSRRPPSGRAGVRESVPRGAAGAGRLQSSRPPQPTRAQGALDAGRSSCMLPAGGV